MGQDYDVSDLLGALSFATYSSPLAASWGVGQWSGHVRCSSLMFALKRKILWGQVAWRTTRRLGRHLCLLPQ